MEELEAEIGVELLAEQRLVRLEADVAPGVEIEVGEAVRQGRNGRVVGRRGEIARPLDHVRVAERRRRARSALRRVGLGRRMSEEARARGGGDAGDERAA